MTGELKKARQRPIRIAAMGTKKAGKSVVINSLLKRDYAPTSSELPTPNVIKYIPAEKDAGLTLDYKGKMGIPFQSAKELSDYIGDEFVKAQKNTGEGSGLEDMVIHYPSDDLNGYEVWDTPGPNFAGAGEEHHKIADKCIKEADVCIFVMNYSNYLTDDEVKFLKKIHDTFREENKFYSLFITVNRIDERYAAEVEKSVNRILDYIRIRLEELDYKNIVVFGTSALQSFYLDKVLKFFASNGITIDEDNTLQGVTRKAKKAYREYMTPLRFVEDSIKNLEDFHDIDDPDVTTLENFSGIPQLWRHVRYIGEKKVDTEIVDHVVSSCEMEFDKINNALLVTELRNLSEEDSKRLRELQSKLQDLNDTVYEAMSEVHSHIGDEKSETFRAIKGDISEVMKIDLREVINTSVARNSEITKRLSISDNDVEALGEGRMTDNVRQILKAVDGVVEGANSGLGIKFLKLIEIKGGELSKRVEETVNKAQDKIVEKTEEIKQSVDSDSIAGNMMRSFAVPQFPVSLNQLASTSRGLSIDLKDTLVGIAKDSTRYDKEKRTHTVKKKRESRGLWEGIQEFFGKEFYEDVEEYFTVEVAKKDAVKFRSQLQKILQQYIEVQLRNSYELMEDEVKEKIKKIYLDLGEQCERITGTYHEIFETFSEDINDALDETTAHQQAIEHDILILTDIKNKVQPFFELWRSILSGKAAG